VGKNYCSVILIVNVIDSIYFMVIIDVGMNYIIPTKKTKKIKTDFYLNLSLLKNIIHKLIVVSFA